MTWSVAPGCAGGRIRGSPGFGLWVSCSSPRGYLMIRHLVSTQPGSRSGLRAGSSSYQGSPSSFAAVDGRRIVHRFSAFDGLSPEQVGERAIGVTLSPVCGGRQSSRRRTALLTVLGVIAAERMAVQFGHTNATSDVHETLPADIRADALAPRRAPERGAVNWPVSLPARARAPSPTSAVSPCPCGTAPVCSGCDRQAPTAVPSDLTPLPYRDRHGLVRHIPSRTCRVTR